MDLQMSGNKWFYVTTNGMARIQNAISGLEQIQQTKAITSGMRAAGGVFMAGGRRRLKSELLGHGSRGNLMKAFRVRVKRRNEGVLIGFDRMGHHSHLVDLGTKKRFHKSGKYVGIMPANYFWRTTAEADFPKAAEKLYQGIETAANRIMNGTR